MQNIYEVKTLLLYYMLFFTKTSDYPERQPLVFLLSNLFCPISILKKIG